MGGCTPLPPWPVFGSLIVSVGVKVAIPNIVARGPRPAALLVCLYRRRIGLHDVIARRPRHAVLVRTVIDHRRLTTKVVVRRWRSRGPLYRGGFPWIVTRLRSFKHAPEQVEQEYELGRDGDKGRKRNERVQRNQTLHVGHLSELRVTPGLARHAQIMHGHE